MHELGIMTGVAEAVERAALDAGATAVLGITLEVGEMTEAIPDALFFAFEVLQESNPFLAEAELRVNMVKPHSKCLECGAEYDHDRFHMLCPACGGAFTQLMRGRELRIESMEVDIPDECDESDDETDK